LKEEKERERVRERERERNSRDEMKESKRIGELRGSYLKVGCVIT